MWLVDHPVVSVKTAHTPEGSSNTVTSNKQHVVLTLVVHGGNLIFFMLS